MCEESPETLICYTVDKDGCHVPCQGSQFLIALVITIAIVLSCLILIWKFFKFLGLKRLLITGLVFWSFALINFKTGWINVCDGCTDLWSYSKKMAIYFMLALIILVVVDCMLKGDSYGGGGGYSGNESSYDPPSNFSKNNWAEEERKKWDKINEDRREELKRNIERQQRNEAEYRRQREIAAQEKYAKDLREAQARLNRARGW